MTPRIFRKLVTTAATCLDQERSSLMMIPRYLNSDTHSTGFPLLLTKTLSQIHLFTILIQDTLGLCCSNVHQCSRYYCLE